MSVSELFTPLGVTRHMVPVSQGIENKLFILWNL